jgi:hypothetical protein
MFTLTQRGYVTAAGLGGGTGSSGRPASFTLNGAPCAVA